MAKLVLLLVCVTVFQIANALQCYHCQNEQCDQDVSKQQKNVCSKSADPKLIPACLKYVYKDPTSQKKTTTRKCILKHRDEAYTCTPPTGQNGEEDFCETCETDLCNSAPSTGLSFVAVAGIFLAMLGPKFLA
ncbi:hypothetical protein NQ315_000432 [Exocentrus adspersus]|uniref:Protein sleepless n=1 Tax=Exocentrus adspersus TaxID=1586481 RepID=A0AAV8VMD3_9CUCU|nr:hypothetical protein NQ315_000432 [Exocentrus adspersus]